jgi:hypothetical protein
LMPRLPLAGAAVAAIVLTVAWRSHRAHDSETAQLPEVAATSPSSAVESAPARIATGPRLGDTGDVSTELAALPEARTRGYAEATAELMGLANDARTAWPEQRRQAFDARVAELRTAVDHAEEGPARQHAYRTLVRYLQRVVVRDEVALNERTPGWL